MKYDAILTNWKSVQVTNKESVMYGEILEDKKGRFQNGDPVRTSGFKNQKLEEGMILKTRNTSYLLSKPMVNK